MFNKRLIAAGLLSFIMVTTGCTNGATVQTKPQEVEVPVEEVADTDVEVVEPEVVEEPIVEELDLQAIKPNEIGQIMVIMYHSLGKKNADYIRTPESFREDLELLYENGYRPISMEDYINNTIAVEAGMTPVVLTFDDGHVTNFNILDEETKEIDPNCSLGIMEAFNKEHPDFELKGVFYLNGGVPFKQASLLDYKLNYLIDNGLEIGNHSYGHENFKKISADKVTESLGKNEQKILSIVPNAKITSLALPFGSRPANKSDHKVLISGQYEETNYEYTSILNVGWKPEYASIHTKFNPYSINRVHSGDKEFELAYWVDYFDQNDGKRYISDGDSSIVTVRETDLDKINGERMGNLEIRSYIPEE